jgi:hypothetical protein
VVFNGLSNCQIHQRGPSSASTQWIGRAVKKLGRRSNTLKNGIPGTPAVHI